MFVSRRHLLLSAALPWLPQDVRFSAGVQVVTLFATVRDRNGRLINDLAKNDFELTEDGQPQAISYFSHETDLPLTIGLLIDTSRSQYGILESERRASYAFIRQVLREGKDAAFVTEFDIKVTMLQDVTTSASQLQTALRSVDLPKPRRGPAEPPRPSIPTGTRLYDAIVRTSDRPMQQQSGRKALILLTDGMNSRSRHVLADAVEHAQRADSLVYSILYADPHAYPNQPRDPESGLPAGVASQGRQNLREFAAKTGGRFFVVSKEQPIERIYSQIEEELRSQYSIGYTPVLKNPSTGYRKLTLTTKQKDLQVTTRDGYYP